MIFNEMMTNPKRPTTEEFAKKNRELQEQLLAFAEWFHLSFHAGDPADHDADFEDSIIQTLALANMAMVESLSVHYGRRIDVENLLTPVIRKTRLHDKQQNNCPHRGNGIHNCGDHQ